MAKATESGFIRVSSGIKKKLLIFQNEIKKRTCIKMPLGTLISQIINQRLDEELAKTSPIENFKEDL
jgi:hypothetical protein